MTDYNARQTDKGDWKCGACVSEESIELLGLMRRVNKIGYRGSD